MYTKIKFQKCQHFTSTRQDPQEKAKGAVLCAKDVKYKEVRRSRWQTWSCENGTDFNGFSAWRGEEAHDTHTDTAWKAWKRSSGHQEKQSRETPAGGYLQRCHVVEGIVQLLANCFVLELLSVQFVWRSEVNRKFNRAPRAAGARKSRRRNEAMKKGGREGGKEKTNIGEVFWKALLIAKRPIAGLVCGSSAGFWAMKSVWQLLWIYSAWLWNRTLPTHKQAAEGL